jgi:hypothetical protein
VIAASRCASASTGDYNDPTLLDAASRRIDRGRYTKRSRGAAKSIAAPNRFAAAPLILRPLHHATSAVGRSGSEPLVFIVCIGLSSATRNETHNSSSVGPASGAKSMPVLTRIISSEHWAQGRRPRARPGHLFCCLAPIDSPYLRESSDTPSANAFCRVAPSLLFSARAIFAAGVLCFANFFRSRIFSFVHSRRFGDFFAT